MSVRHAALTAFSAALLTACGAAAAVSPPSTTTTTTIHSIVAAAQPAAPAERLRPPDRLIPHPANAVCVPETDLAADPAGTLQRLMIGQYGPIGDWLMSDMGGAVNIGGPQQWWFGLGDTLIGDNANATMPYNGADFIHNSALIQDGNCFWVQTGHTPHGGPASYIPDQTDGSYYWPQGSFVAGDRMYTFAVQVRPTGGTGMFAFEPFDIDLAVTDLNNLAGQPTIIDAGPWEHIDTKRLETVSVVETGDGTVAISFQYGLNSANLGIARIADPTHPLTGWTVWDGSGWTVNLAAAAPVHTAVEGDSAGGHPFERNGRWYLMTWRWTVDGIGYQLYSAAALTGPYIEAGRWDAIWPYGHTSNDAQYGHTLYGAYPTAGGDILMVWSNNAGFDAGVLLARSRPTFTTFNTGSLTADTPAA